MVVWWISERMYPWWGLYTVTLYLLVCQVVWWVSERMYPWWGLYTVTLYLLVCQVRVTVGDSGLCSCLCVMSFECWLTPLLVDCGVSGRSGTRSSCQRKLQWPAASQMAGSSLNPHPHPCGPQPCNHSPLMPPRPADALESFQRDGRTINSTQNWFRSTELRSSVKVEVAVLGSRP